MFVVLEVIVCCILCMLGAFGLVLLLGSNALKNSNHPVKMWLLNILYLILVGGIYTGAIILIILF